MDTVMAKKQRSMLDPARPHIRWMIRRDMADILAIENESFEFPWREKQFRDCLKTRNCIGMVAERNNRVVGFMIYELHRSRLQLFSLAVGAAYRRTGVGSAFIEKLKGKLLSHRRTRILCEVRESNLAAQVFFRSQQFRAVAVLREFYDDIPEDAYLFQYGVQEQQATDGATDGSK